jgi:hypothetical protein
MHIEFYEADQRLSLLASIDAQLTREDEAERRFQDYYNQQMGA